MSIWKNLWNMGNIMKGKKNFNFPYEHLEFQQENGKNAWRILTEFYNGPDKKKLKNE